MQTKIKDKMTPLEKLITCESTDKMGTLVSKLFTNKVSSLPIFDKEENRYNAFFDYTDAVSYIVQYYETRGSGGVEASFAETQYSKDVLGADYRNWSGSFVTNISDTDSLKRALDISVSLANLHRLPVFNLSGDFKGILSQSDLFYSLAAYISTFPLANNTLQNLQIGFNKNELLQAQASSPLIDLFKIISKNRVSGIAILDGESLVGNLSASDIKIIGEHADNLSVLATTTVRDVIKKRPIVVYPHSTIQQVVEVITKERIHRVYIIDSVSFAFIGVISLIDILSLITKYM